MAVERVDVEVTGKVTGSIESRLRGIASESRKAGTALQQLQETLNRMDSGGLGQLQTQLNNASTQLAKQSREIQNLDANNRMLSANLRVMTGQLAAAQAQVQALTAAEQASAAAAQTAAQGQRDLGQAATGAGAAAGASQRQWGDYNTGLARTGQNAQLARHHLINLGFQLQDIGVSLASGQNPLTVAVQQGAQIQGIAAQAGVGIAGLARGVVALLAPMLPLAAALAAVAGGLKLLSVEWSKSAELKAYSESLGLTSKQIKKLDGDVITMGDTFKSFFTTLSDATGAGDMWSGFVDGATKAFKNVAGLAADAFNSIGAASSAVAAVIANDWAQTDPRIRNIIARMWNSLVLIFETGVNTLIKGVNQVIAAFNKLATVKVDPFSEISLPKISTNQQENEYKSAGTAFAEAYEASYKARSAQTQKFMDDWQKNATKRAQERIKEGFEKLGGGKSEESRAAALAKINAQLDSEIARNTMLAPQREAQQKFDQINEQLIGRRIKLTDQEAASIKAKIAQIQAASAAQAQMDSYYEQATGPQKTYEAQQSALNTLLQKGAITQQQYNGFLAQSQEAYANAQDPLREYTQQLQFEQQNIGKSNEEREIAIQLRELEQSLLGKGVVLTQQQTDAITAQMQASQRAQAVQSAYNDIYSSTAGALQGVQDKQTALNMAYQNGVISLQSYQAQMGNLQIQAASLRVAMGQAVPGDEMLASLEQVMQGFNGFTSGAIDSVGTLINTMTDGFANAFAGAIAGTESFGDALADVAAQAVQQLIASLIKVGLQYLINAAIANTALATTTAASSVAAATTATAWAPAAALVSLASFGANAGPAVTGMGAAMVASQSFAALAGFEEGGYTGDYGRQAIAGVVHGGEYVMNADTVNRVGLDNLESIQNGGMVGTASSTAVVSAQSGSAGRVTVNVINNLAAAQVTQTQQDDGQGGTDVTIQLDSIENALASRMASGRGALHKSTKQAFNLNPATVDR